MKRAFLLFTFLTSQFLMSFQSFASQCNLLSGAFDRYRITGSVLNDGDQLDLQIGSKSYSLVVDANTLEADQWVYLLSDWVSTQAADLANSGDPLANYTPVYSSNGNVIDTIVDNLSVSLSLNGQDFSSALVEETAPAATFGNSALLPFWAVRLSASAQGYFIYLSNVSQADITVNLDLITHDGSKYLEASESGADFSFTNLAGDPTLAAGTQLSAQKSGYMYIRARGALKQGFGHVSWTSTQCVDKALVAHGARYWAYSGSVAHSMVPVNDGNPF